MHLGAGLFDITTRYFEPLKFPEEIPRNLKMLIIRKGWSWQVRHPWQHVCNGLTNQGTRTRSKTSARGKLRYGVLHEWRTMLFINDIVQCESTAQCFFKQISQPAWVTPSHFLAPSISIGPRFRLSLLILIATYRCIQNPLDTCVKNILDEGLCWRNT